MTDIFDETSLSIDIERRIDAILKTDLPLSRVKKIAKLDPEVHLMNNDAARLVAKSTELFLVELAKACFKQASAEKRKTVQKKDLDRVIKTDWMFEFLEDAIDDWPEAGRSKLFGENAETLNDTEELQESTLNETVEHEETADDLDENDENLEDVENDENIADMENEENIEDMETLPLTVDLNMDDNDQDIEFAEESGSDEDVVEETPDIFE